MFSSMVIFFLFFYVESEQQLKIDSMPLNSPSLKQSTVEAKIFLDESAISFSALEVAKWVRRAKKAPSLVVPWTEGVDVLPRRLQQPQQQTVDLVLHLGRLGGHREPPRPSAAPL